MLSCYVIPEPAYTRTQDAQYRFASWSKGQDGVKCSSRSCRLVLLSEVRSTHDFVQLLSSLHSCSEPEVLCRACDGKARRDQAFCAEGTMTRLAGAMLQQLFGRACACGHIRLRGEHRASQRLSDAQSGVTGRKKVAHLQC